MLTVRECKVPECTDLQLLAGEGLTGSIPFL